MFFLSLQNCSCILPALPLYTQYTRSCERNLKERLFRLPYMTNVRSWLSAYRDACESVINKRVAVHTVKSLEPRVRIDQITIGRHVRRRGTEGSRSLTSIAIVISLILWDVILSSWNTFILRVHISKISKYK